MSDGTAKRRWFQFSLRTLFMVVTLLGMLLGWLGWNVSEVRERNALLKSFASRGVWCEFVPGDQFAGRVPLAWQALGVKPTHFNSALLPQGEFSEYEVRRLKACFPDVILWHADKLTDPPWTAATKAPIPATIRKILD